MNFREALEAFQRGEVLFADLEQGVVSTLKNQPASAQMLMEELERGVRDGLIPHQVFVIMATHINMAVQPSEQPVDIYIAQNQSTSQLQNQQPSDAVGNQHEAVTEPVDSLITEDSDATQISRHRPPRRRQQLSDNESVAPNQSANVGVEPLQEKSAFLPSATGGGQEESSLLPSCEEELDPDATQIGVRRPPPRRHRSMDNATTPVAAQPSITVPTPQPISEKNRNQESGNVPLVEAEDEDKTRISIPSVEGHRTASSTLLSAEKTGSGSTTTGSQLTSPPSKTDSLWSRPEEWNDDRDPQVGDTLKERYVLESLLGKGGMGMVFKALDLVFQAAQDRDPYIAVKVLNKEFKAHPESLKALHRETRKSQDLAHPNIINVFGFDRDGSHVYMTMEVLDGDPLDILIKRLAGKGLPIEEALRFTDGMGQALAYAHSKNVVHSDFKPGNIFLTQDKVIKIIDFGIAQATKSAENAGGEKTLFDAGDLGALTPAYASLEMLKGDNPEAADDIYALACVTYELLTGKHPYNKVSANKAQLRKMVPKKVPGLKAYQWKSLSKALQFERANRTATVEEFLDGMRLKKQSKMPIIAGVASAALAAVVGTIFIPGYLHDQDIAELVDMLQNGDDAVITQAIIQLVNLKPTDITTVTTQAQDILLGYYNRRIDYEIGEQNGRYNFDKAEQLLAEAQELRLDFARLRNLTRRTEEAKDDLLVKLDEKYNRFLQEGRLLSDENEENIYTVLDIVKKIDPDNSLLDDTRLANAFVDSINRARAKRNYADAELLLSSALEKYASNNIFIELRDQINNEKDQASRTQIIEQLENSLSVTYAKFDSLDDLESQRVDLAELRNLKERSPIFIDYQHRGQTLINQQLKAMVSAKQWATANDLLTDYDYLLDRQFSEQKITELKAAREHIEGLINGIFNKLIAVLKRGELAKTKGGSVYELITQLDKAGADDDLLTQAKTIVAQTYLEMARDERAKENWKEARKRVESGLKMMPEGDIAFALKGEGKAIVQAENLKSEKIAAEEVERIERERSEQIVQLQSNFEHGLAQEGFGVDEARKLLRVLNELASLSPFDPLVSTGRDKVAVRLSDEINELAGKGLWEEGIKLTDSGLDVLPESAHLAKDRTLLKKGLAQYKADQFVKNIEQRKQHINELLVQDKYTKSWTSQLHKALEELARKVPNDTFVDDKRELVGTLLFGKVEVARDRQRFTEAKTLLAKAKKLAPRHTALVESAQLLADAETAYAEENKARIQMAKIDGLKNTLTVQARANKVKSAKGTLGKLRELLPVDTPYITETAPKLIAESYLRLASNLADKKQFTSAEMMADVGLKLSPHMPKLLEAKKTYREKANFNEFKSLLLGSKTIDVAKLKKRLTKIKAEDSQSYAKLQLGLVKSLATKVRQLDLEHHSKAKQLLQIGKQVFPGSQALNAIKLQKPIVVVKTPVKKEPVKKPIVVVITPVKKEQIQKPAQAEKVVTKPVVQTVVTDTARPAKDRCKPRLAGYGRKGRGACYDTLPGDVRSPILVVVPGIDGNAPFAISKYEVSIKEFNHYCLTSGSCTPKDSGSGNLPITNVPKQQVFDYLQWLTAETGFHYRLPSAAEWAHAANANGKQPSGGFNCKLTVGGKLVKGYGLVDAKQGKANGWGLVNYVGNAQELTLDGQQINARGGKYSDSTSLCKLSLSRPYSGDLDSVTGLRLLREVKGG